MACIYNRREAFLFGLQQKININTQNDDVFNFVYDRLNLIE